MGKFLILFLFAYAAQASSGPSDAKLPGVLKDLSPHAVKYLIGQSADPTSLVAKRIVQANIEGKDGKNPQGIISLPLKAADLGAVAVGGTFTDEFVSCQPSQANPKHKECENDQSVEVLVSIPSRKMVEYGVEYGNLSFLVSMDKIKTWQADSNDIANHPVSGPPKVEIRVLDAMEIPMDPY